MGYILWLVVYLPLWKMMEFVSWDHYSQYMEKMFQTTNQVPIRTTMFFQFQSHETIPGNFWAFLPIESTEPGRSWWRPSQRFLALPEAEPSKKTRDSPSQHWVTNQNFGRWSFLNQKISTLTENPCFNQNWLGFSGFNFPFNSGSHHHLKLGFQAKYTGWWLTYPSDKWWSSSVGMMTFPIWWESHNPAMFQTTNPCQIIPSP